MEFEIKKIKREIVIDGFNSIYYFEFGKNFSHPPEKHDFWELVYIDSGEINAVTNGLGTTLRQGEILFHRPNEVHAHVSNKIVSSNMLVISFTSRSGAMEFFDKKTFTLDKTAKTLLSLFVNEAKTALGEIPGEYSNKNPLDFSSAPFGSVQLLECYLTEFLLNLKRMEDGASSQVKRSEVSRELADSSMTELFISYLKENIYSNLTLSDICTKFYVGKSYLCKLFSEHVGEGPIEYYNKLKITEAKHLLLDGESSVSRISDMLGYSSIHNFSRAFKKATGVSPTDYKKRVNG